MGPNRLNTLPMSQPNFIFQRDVELDLAAGAMSHKVEFWHGSTEGGELCEVVIHGWEISWDPAVEIADPLACDVVCNEEAADPCFEVGEDGR